MQICHVTSLEMEDIDGGLHPAVDGQNLDEDEDEN